MPDFIPDVVKDIWEKYKVLIIAGVAVLLLLLIVPRIISSIMIARANKTPIVKIEATNDNVYKKDTKIKPEDFKVTAIHEDGKTTSVKSDQIKISREQVTAIGEVTSVEVSLIENEDISCTVDVKNSRKKIRSFKCGFPNESDVKAVIYSNGELAFEGSGAVRDFSEFPWLEYDEKRDYPITSISFGKKLEPQYMDGWFAGIETLTYVDPIPSSVVSMNGTFKDCVALKTPPKWDNCKKLVDITEIYSGCESLRKVPAIPASVKIASGMCEDCISLVDCPEMKQASSIQDLSNAFKGCTSLTTAKLPPKADNLESTFEGCINIAEMPTVPVGVTNMNNTFKDNSSLQTLKNIPGTTMYANGCFENCIRASGILTIDATLLEYSGIFNNVASSSTLDIRGNGLNLNDVVWEAENPNIVLNGKAAVNPETTEQQEQTTEAQ